MVLHKALLHTVLQICGIQILVVSSKLHKNSNGNDSPKGKYNNFWENDVKLLGDGDLQH